MSLLGVERRRLVSVVILACLALGLVAFTLSSRGHAREELPWNIRTEGIVIGGSVMLGRDVERRILQGIDPFAEAGPLLDAAVVSIVGLDSPLTRSDDAREGATGVRARPESVSILLEAGIDATALATPSLMDFGQRGLAETIRTLDRAGIGHVGAGDDLTAATQPVTSDVQGKRVEILAYAMVDRDDPDAAGLITSGIAPYSPDTFDRQVRFAVASSDVTIVLLQLPRSLGSAPRAGDLEAARRAIDLGADAVVGIDPGTTRGIEVYRGRPIFYSIGELVGDFGSAESPSSFLIGVDLSGPLPSFTLYPYRVNRSVPTFLDASDANRLLDAIDDLSPRPVVTVEGGLGYLVGDGFTPRVG